MLIYLFFALQLGCLYQAGEHVGMEKNLKLASEFFKKGCELHDTFSCLNLSTMYHRGDGVEKNADLALRYFEMAKGKRSPSTS